METDDNKFYSGLDLSKNISSTVAFAVILILSFVVALYTLNAAENVKNNFPESDIVQIHKRPGGADVDLK
jgi:hypothetical protein